MTTTRIAAVATNRPWRVRLQAHVLDHLGDIEFKVMRDPDILNDLRPDVIIIDDSVSLFGDHELRAMIGNGHMVVGIFDPEGMTGRGQAALEALGIEVRLADTLDPATLAEHILEAAAEAAPKAQFIDEPTTDAGELFDPVSRTRLLVVGGPDTEISVEVACGFADAAASRSLPLLADLNEVDPAVAARLGLRLDPSLLDAVTYVTAGKDLTPALGHSEPDAAAAPSYDVLTGLARSNDWHQLDPHGVEQVLAHGMAMWDRVIACVGPRLERVVRRHDVSRAAVSVADELAIVLRPNPMGLLRGLEWLVEARRIRPELPAMFLFYGRPSKYRCQEMVNLLLDRVPEDAIDTIEFLPTGASVDKAIWQGTAAGGAFNRTLRSIEQRLEAQYNERTDGTLDAEPDEDFDTPPAAGSGIAEQTLRPSDPVAGDAEQRDNERDGESADTDDQLSLAGVDLDAEFDRRFREWLSHNPDAAMVENRIEPAAPRRRLLRSRIGGRS
jgi:hypothetical protein